jgi:acetolactate synthase-1/2/3 large subunit
MQQSRHRAIAALKGARAFSTTARVAQSPLVRPAAAATPKSAAEDAKRTQSTAAAAQPQGQQRARPAPAFNREDYSSVSPLKPYRSPEMDHSFVGMTGGQIFHEMMLRQGVKHIFGYPGGAILPQTSSPPCRTPSWMAPPWSSSVARSSPT